MELFLGTILPTIVVFIILAGLLAAIILLTIKLKKNPTDKEIELKGLKRDYKENKLSKEEFKAKKKELVKKM